MDEPATSIIQGEIRVIGKAHGALNTLIVVYGHEADWVMKQFVTEDELNSYAREWNLAIIPKE